MDIFVESRFLLQVIKYAGLRYIGNQNPFPRPALYNAYVHALLLDWCRRLERELYRPLQSCSPQRRLDIFLLPRAGRLPKVSLSFLFF